MLEILSFTLQALIGVFTAYLVYQAIGLKLATDQNAASSIQDGNVATAAFLALLAIPIVAYFSPTHVAVACFVALGLYYAVIIRSLLLSN